MDLLNSSEIFKTYLPVLLITYIATWFGSYWIDKLYTQEEDSNLLSFPKQIAQRSRFRKPLLFVLLAVCIGKSWSITTGTQLFYFVIAIVLLVFITITDFEQYVIFDFMLIPLAVTGACYTLHMQLSITEHLASALCGGGLFFLLTVLTKGAIGGGDIKLITAMGLWLGWKPLLSVILYGAMAGGVAAFLLLISKRIQRKQFLAYGPYFALGAIGVLLNLIKPIF